MISEILQIQPRIFKSFSQSIEQFFLTVGQKNFSNKIQFLNSTWVYCLWSTICIIVLNWFYMSVIKSRNSSNHRIKTLVSGNMNEYEQTEYEWCLIYFRTRMNYHIMFLCMNEHYFFTAYKSHVLKSETRPSLFKIRL